eukprot:2894160-Rhodomonas_salina.1
MVPRKQGTDSAVVQQQQHGTHSAVARYKLSRCTVQTQQEYGPNTAGAPYKHSSNTVQSRQ